MWAYYGAKTNVIQHYPPPKFGKVIEPFCGSARYALRFFDREVIIVDKYELLINLWQWIQKCSPKDILSLPRLRYGECLDDFNFDIPEAKHLMGFLMGFSAESPRLTATVKLKHRPNYINYSLNRIAGNLFKIKHWQIICDSYENIPNHEACYFVDPPYVFSGGHSYIESSKNIDFNHLREWCLTRNGQVIVCEGAGANWLDFKPVKTHRTRNGSSQEMIWTNLDSAFNNEQLKLF